MPLPTGDLLTETFDNTTDYDNAGWSASGTVNPNYTGTVLEGTQSLQLDGSSVDSHINKTITGRSSVYMYFQLRMPNLPSDSVALVYFFDAFQNNYLLRLFIIMSSGSLFLYNGGVTSASTSVGTLSANTTYHFWLTYIKGTGANGVSSVGFSTDGVRPTSGNNYLEVTNGNATTNFTDLQINALHPSLGGTWTPIFDRVVLNSTQIGDATTATNVSVDLTGVAASAAVGTLGFNVSLPLVGVASTPVIGTGTVTIGGVVVEPPPVGVGGGTGRTGMRLRPAEDIRLYLEGVAANPRVGQVTLLSDMARAYEGYMAPIRKAEARKPAEMPPGMRQLFKPVEKLIPPVVFVYQVGLPKLHSAVGRGTVTAHFEDIDEEMLMLIDSL